MATWDSSYDNNDTGFGGTGDPSTATAPSGDPWTPDELAESQQWANNWYSSHQIPQTFGTPDDIARSYLNFRRSGASHADAMAQLANVPAQLGWDKYAPPTNSQAGTQQSPGQANSGSGQAMASAAPGGAPGGSSSAFPMFSAPGFTSQQGVSAPSNPYTFAPSTFTPFAYKNFSAPTLEEAKNQPGYQFGLQQGQDALQNAAAARGTLRGGGTLKDLFGYTNAAAEQNYGNVFNQQKSIYDTNRDNAFGTWAANNGGRLAVDSTNNAGNLSAYNTNFGVAKYVNSSGNAANQGNYQNAFQNASAEFNPLFQGSTLTFQDTYNRWLAKLNSLTNIATAGAS